MTRSRPRVVAVLTARSTESSGGAMRDQHLVAGLSRVADVRVLTLTPLARDAVTKLEALLRVPVSSLSGSTRGRARRALEYVTRRDVPWRATHYDRKRLHGELAVEARDADALFLRRPLGYAVLDPGPETPVITDFDDVPTHFLRQLHAESAPASDGSLARRVARDQFLRVEARRWAHAQRAVIAGSARVFVCSQSDLELLGSPRNGVVVPNGFSLAGEPAGSPDVGTPPTVTFWGLMAYGPNAQGARWLVDAVLPHLRRLVPDVRIQIVGAGSEQLRLGDDPSVRPLGFVPDLQGVLRQTDVAAVPLRVGGGTRIKIIEAWANRIPVVATRAGAYGLCERPGDGALLADTPEEFARAAHQLLVDRPTRAAVVERGTQLARGLQWDAVEETVARSALAVLDHVIPDE